jgi:hypothetical protein
MTWDMRFAIREITVECPDMTTSNALNCWAGRVDRAGTYKARHHANRSSLATTGTKSSAVSRHQATPRVGLALRMEPAVHPGVSRKVSPACKWSPREHHDVARGPTEGVLICWPPREPDAEPEAASRLNYY